MLYCYFVLAYFLLSEEGHIFGYFSSDEEGSVLFHCLLVFLLLLLLLSLLLFVLFVLLAVLLVLIFIFVTGIVLGFLFLLHSGAGATLESLFSLILVQADAHPLEGFLDRISLYVFRLVHPLSIIGLFEKLRHELLEFLVVSLPEFSSASAFQPVEQIVDDPHYQVVVVPVLAVLQNYFGLAEVVVFEVFYIVDLVDHRGEFLVDLGAVGEGISFTEVGQHLSDEMLVDGLEICWFELMGLAEAGDVFDDVLGAEYFGLLEVHLSSLKVVEGGGEDCAYHIRQPLLQLSLLQFGPLRLWEGKEHFPVPGLYLVLLPLPLRPLLFLLGGLFLRFLLLNKLSEQSNQFREILLQGVRTTLLLAFILWERANSVLLLLRLFHN